MIFGPLHLFWHIRFFYFYALLNCYYLASSVSFALLLIRNSDIILIKPSISRSVLCLCWVWKAFSSEWYQTWTLRCLVLSWLVMNRINDHSCNMSRCSPYALWCGIYVITVETQLQIALVIYEYCDDFNRNISEIFFPGLLGTVDFREEISKTFPPSSDALQTAYIWQRWPWLCFDWSSVSCTPSAAHTSQWLWKCNSHHSMRLIPLRFYQRFLQIF